MILQTFWSVLLIFFTILMILFSVILDFDRVSTIRQVKSTTSVRKIVAYSLKKQIELEGKEYVCDKSFENLNFPGEETENKFWQKLDDTEIHVASVTLDKRLHPYHYLRIVAVIKGSWNHTTLYCQIRRTDGHVHVMKSTVTSMWYEKWNMNDNNTYYNPILVSCRLPSSEMTSRVTLSIKPCALPKTSLKISRPFDQSASFTICVKPLNFQKDISKHLIEWIEICKILGAERFHIFVNNVTDRTRKILEWYQFQFPNTMYVEYFRPVKIDECRNCTSTGFFHEMWQRRRYEVVAYNMCFNKNINAKFVVPLDIDEIIVPKSVNYWKDLVKHFDNYTSLIVQNVYYFMRKRKNRYYRSPFFLSENRRNKVPSEKGENGKSFISTKNALTVFNHYALHSLKPGVFKQYFLPFRDVQLNHYKESCNRIIFPECTKYLSSATIFDNIISKYKIEFEKNYGNVINRLKEEQIYIS